MNEVLLSKSNKDQYSFVKYDAPTTATLNIYFVRSLPCGDDERNHPNYLFSFKNATKLKNGTFLKMQLLLKIQLS